MAADWAWLPKNVLDCILEKLDSVYDYVRCAVVCKPWLSVARDPYHHKKRLDSNSCHRQLPMLLIPTKEEHSDGESQSHRALHTVIGWKTLESKLRVPFYRRCCGSSHGWLIFADQHNVTLFNPFTAATILLPPIKINQRMPDDEQYEVRKVILSKDPCLAQDDYQLLALYEYEGNVAFFRSGEDAWVYPTKAHLGHLIFKDIIYHKERFFVVSQEVLACLQVDTTSVTLEEVKRRFSEEDMECYLAESYGGAHLLFIERHHIPHAAFYEEYAHHPLDHGLRQDGYFKIDETLNPYYPTYNRLADYFIVYKVMEVSEGEVEYIEVNDMGDQAMFIGFNDAVTVLSSKFPGCEPNTIYYTDEYWESIKGAYMPYGPIDMGFFRLSDLEVAEANRRYILDTSIVSKDLPPPIWIVPKANL